MPPDAVIKVTALCEPTEIVNLQFNSSPQRLTFRVALGTRHIDYNGLLCMVSAGTAYKLAFGIDRSTIPWSEIPKAEVLLVIGANVGECAPITTDYIWRCRDNGGRLIVADPRMTPITQALRSCSLTRSSIRTMARRALQQSRMAAQRGSD